jgi:hypothetical protein
MIPLSLKANVLICVCILISVQCGCAAKSSSPSKAELETLLGKLDESVVVLGGKVVATEGELATRTPQSENLQSSICRLWVVASRDALPCPYPRDQTSLDAMRNAPDPKIHVQLNAFPAIVAYDIAVAVGVSPASLTVPINETPQKAKGRISEWPKDNNQIRIRDFRTTGGWLSIVESFDDSSSP